MLSYILFILAALGFLLVLYDVLVLDPEKRTVLAWLKRKQKALANIIPRFWELSWVQRTIVSSVLVLLPFLIIAFIVTHILDIHRIFVGFAWLFSSRYTAEDFMHSQTLYTYAFGTAFLLFSLLGLPFLLLKLAEILLRSVEILLRRLSQYGRGPFFALGLLLAGLAALLKAIP